MNNAPVRAAANLLAALLVLAAAAVAISPFASFRRISDQPVISPQGDQWESAGAFNPAVLQYKNKFIMLYRAQDHAGTSRLAYADSADGVHFARRAEPVFSPEADYEKNGGIEDPRIVQIGSTFYPTYTAYNKTDAQLCLATSKDLVHWDRKGILLPAYKGNWNVGWTKSGAILSKKINGKYWMYWLGTTPDKTDQMGLSWSTDLIHWTEATPQPVLPKRPGMFDSRVVEPGPPPVVTRQGIVLLYNGADDNLVYRTGVAVFDRNDPTKLVSRTDTPVFAPDLAWEKTGQVPNVVFVEGLAKKGKSYLLYYGAADKYVGVAESDLKP